MDADDSDIIQHAVFSGKADVVIYRDPTYLCYVSTEDLGSVSPVFRAMFGPNFAEGRAVIESKGKSLPVIEFPDDDEIALQWLFWILHLKNARFEEDVIVTAEAVEQLAILADKYDCMATVAPVSSTLLENLNIRTTSGQYDPARVHNAQLVDAACRFDNAEYFQKYTNALVRRDEDDLLENTKILNISRVQALHDRDRECRKYLDGKIAELAGCITPHLFQRYPPHSGYRYCEDCNTSADSDGHCVFHQRLAARYLEHLGKKLLYPMPASALGLGYNEVLNNIIQRRTHTLKGLLREIERLGHPDCQDLHHCDQGQGCRLRDFQLKIEPKMEELKECARKMWAGLCLDCLKEPDNVDTVCRVQHGPFTLMRDLRASKKREHEEESDSEEEVAESEPASARDEQWEDVESEREGSDDAEE